MCIKCGVDIGCQPVAVGLSNIPNLSILWVSVQNLITSDLHYSMKQGEATQSNSNPQPSDPKEWDSASYRGWDARSLPGDLETRYAHLARFARYASNIPGTQDEAARLMDEILTPIPIHLM